MRSPSDVFSSLEPQELRGSSLSADAELGDDCAVTLNIVVFHVIQKAATATDHLHQPTSGVMIMLVSL